MKKMITRLAEPKDAEKCAEWAVERELVSTALGYPSALTFAVEENEETVLFQTAHPVLMLEAMVLQPRLSTMRSARGIKALYDSMKQLCREYGLKEMYLFTPIEDEQKMLEKHGMFERIDMPCFRCKV